MRQPDLFPEAIRWTCPVCSGHYTRGCPRCEIHNTEPPPLPPEVLLELEREAAAREARDARLRALGRPVRVAIVACSATKRPGRHTARELYASPLFRLSLAYAEAHADELRIASAKYRILHPDRLIDHYDERLPQRQRELALWGLCALTDLRLDYCPVGVPVHLILLAGRNYAEPILEAGLPDDWTFELPLAGLQIGQRLSFLAAALRGALAARATSGVGAAAETP